MAPIACRIRPGFGSAPNSAVFTSGESATARATVRASDSFPAPTTSTNSTWLTPSPSWISCDASDAPTSSIADAKPSHPESSGDTRSRPAAPLAKSSTVSLVLVHPSTVMALNAGARASRVSVCRSFWAMLASVVTNASIVARFGLIMPTPLAAPPTRYPSASLVACFATVSVVRIAAAKSSPPSGTRPAISDGNPPTRLSMCNGSPITPVEHASSSVGANPSAAAAAATAAAASSSPRGPVAALACPLFTSTPRPSPAARCFRDSVTGAATTEFVVKTPAAVVPSSPSSSARSSEPLGFIPAATPAARNPRG